MKIARRFIASIILVAFAMLLLTACSGETALIVSDTSMEMSYNNFSGTETHTVVLEAGTIVTFNMVTRRGTLDISIRDEFGNTAFSGYGVTGNGMSFRIIESGEYTIRVSGNSHMGSFRVSW